jgi:hypothetical protein
VTVTHFYNLAVWGEQILLSIRFGNWNDINTEPAQAANWAVYWRNEIQGYIHAYRAATGVDLTAITTANRVDATSPSIHLRKRFAMQLQGK